MNELWNRQKMKTKYIVIWIMVIREINNKNGKHENWYFIYNTI